MANFKERIMTAKAEAQRFLERCEALEKILDKERHERCYQAEDIKYVFAYHYHEFREIAIKALNEVQS